MKKIFIYKGDRVSEGANNLRNKIKELGEKTLILKAIGSAYNGGDDKLLINWGTSNEEMLRLSDLSVNTLNRPEHVYNASNKLRFLNRMSETLDANIVPFFTRYSEAVQYLRTTRGRIYARTKLNASSGDGIVLMMRDDDPQNNREARRGFNYPVVTYDANGDLVGDTQRGLGLSTCALFTVGHIGPRVEWRVHVFDKQVILVQKKVRTRNPDGDGADANTLVRNLDSGWVYSVNFEATDEDPMDEIRAQAILALTGVGLHFGAVDIIVDKKTKTPRVLEVNTAPGLDEGGSAVNAYANAIIRYANQ